MPTTTAFVDVHSRVDAGTTPHRIRAPDIFRGSSAGAANTSVGSSSRRHDPPTGGGALPGAAAALIPVPTNVFMIGSFPTTCGIVTATRPPAARGARGAARGTLSGGILPADALARGGALVSADSAADEALLPEAEDEALLPDVDDEDEEDAVFEERADHEASLDEDDEDARVGGREGDLGRECRGGGGGAGAVMRRNIANERPHNSTAWRAGSALVHAGSCFRHALRWTSGPAFHRQPFTA